MGATLNVTTYEHAISLFEKNFETHPFWTLYSGKMTNAAARISSYESVGERGEVKEHLDQINYTMGGYGDGYYVLMTRKKPTDTASQQPYYFKKGDVGEIGNMFDFGKIGNTNMSGGNPMQMFMMQAMIKGLSGESNASVAALQKDIEILRLEHQHQRELERERDNVSSRIMGLVENNFDAILGKLPNLQLPKVISKIPAPAPAKAATPQSATVNNGSTRVMHDLPLNHNPQTVSSDAMVHYAKEFQKHFPDVNPSILWAKLVAFAAAQPETAQGLFNQLEASVGETQTDDDE